MASALIKRMETGYVPFRHTLEKYGLGDKGFPFKEKKGPRIRDKEMAKQWASETYYRHHERCKLRNILYKIAVGGTRPRQTTLDRHGLPHDIHALHPIVLNRLKVSKIEK